MKNFPSLFTLKGGYHLIRLKNLRVNTRGLKLTLYARRIHYNVWPAQLKILKKKLKKMILKKVEKVN